ncbi:MAG: formylglycine-generating enzyme family protein [Phycisphaerales bacterium]|nr:formylglycine-generating enzyme family protein [Phycisphaerales bacterium]
MCVLLSLPVLASEDAPDAKPPATPAPVVCAIPGTALNLKMVPVPGPDGKPAFWISDTEISWDHYDVFVYELDEKVNEKVDAVTRPTRPYISADQGWGHAGFPALSVSHRGGKAFCDWLTAATGVKYRLPTLEEWKLVCSLGGVTPDSLDDHAWYKGNSERRTHKLRSKKPDALGLYDIHGNVSEWCRNGKGEDDYVLVGSCYKDETSTCDMTKTQVPAWNDTDPQIPKSIWWLSDAPFAGFRVITTKHPAEAAASKEKVDTPSEKKKP